MNYLRLDEYCSAKMGATKDFKEEWNATRYMVGGKMFALQGEDNTPRPVIILKLPPAAGDFLRRQYNYIIPGYYTNKNLWNSVYPDGSVPDGIVRDMVGKSYAILFSSLTKKAQK
ncbi:MAG: MmcQ/YjbR family DNA-binding protein [Syntrophomonadaceae bacterium]|jgi:predicted DNA-binding protein (MmcQ/YjbR family)|nr:MmcQ/YjbR family DNA-binding protein [Syntrophomonadaceae bacterium]